MAEATWETTSNDVIGTVARQIKVSSISTGQTITVLDFSSIIDISLVLVSDMSTKLTFSKSGNVATLTSSSITNAAAVGQITGTMSGSA